jgi:hypothetical protein
MEGDWGLGIGDWGLAQSPIPNPQSPIPKHPFYYLFQVAKFNKILFYF